MRREAIAPSCAFQRETRKNYLPLFNFIYNIQYFHFSVNAFMTFFDYIPVERSTSKRAEKGAPVCN